jgi:hypothetical protein
MIGDVDLLHTASMARSRRSSLDGGSARPSLEIRSSEPASPTAAAGAAASARAAPTSSGGSGGGGGGGILGSSLPSGGIIAAMADGRAGGGSPFRRMSIQGTFGRASLPSGGAGAGAASAAAAAAPTTPTLSGSGGFGPTSTAPMNAPLRPAPAYTDRQAYPLLSSLSKSLSRKMDTFR